MYLAGFTVAGFVTASVYAFEWLRGSRDRCVRTAPVVPLTVAALAAPAADLRRRLGRAGHRKDPACEACRARGPSDDDARGARAHPRVVRRTRGEVRDRDPQAPVPAHLPPPELDRAGPRHGPGGGPAAGQRRPLRLPHDGRDRHSPGAARRGLPRDVAASSPAAAIRAPEGEAGQALHRRSLLQPADDAV